MTRRHLSILLIVALVAIVSILTECPCPSR